MNIAIVVDDFNVSAWIYSAIEQAIALDDIEVCLLILENKPVKQESKPVRWYDLNSRIYNCYAKWDARYIRKRYIPPENDALALKDIRVLFPNTPVMKIASGMSVAALESLKQYALDVVFQTSESSLTAELATISQYGLWYLYYPDQKNSHERFVGFWECYYGKGTIRGGMRRCTQNKNDPQILAQFNAPVAMVNSPFMTRQILAWDMSALLSLCLQKLLLTGKPELVFKHVGKNSAYDAPMFFFIALMFCKIVFRKASNLFGLINQQWSIQLSRKAHTSSTIPLRKQDFYYLTSPENRFWADPFLFERGGKTWLFFEEYDLSQKGILKVAEINSEGLVDEPVTVMAGDTHFSQPFVFEEEGHIYLLPEQAELNEISLYRCVEFPCQWEKVCTLIENGYYVDPIMYKHNDIWYLFFVDGMTRFGSRSVYGKIYFAHSLTGPWTPHPENPVSMDCRYSRSAGAVFTENNLIIRVTQDCSSNYGYQVNFLEVTDLSEHNYKDQLIASISPESLGVEGVHTYNFTRQFTAIDTRKKHFTSPKLTVFSEDK